jgi:hypothetical protein
MSDPQVLLLLFLSCAQGGADLDELDSTLHKRLNASLSTFSIAQLSLLVSVCGANLVPLGRGSHACLCLSRQVCLCSNMHKGVIVGVSKSCVLQHDVMSLIRCKGWRSVDDVIKMRCDVTDTLQRVAVS